MASCLLFTLLLCGLMVGANARCAPRAGSSCESCPHGWTYYGGQCYLFQESKKDWADAERFCNSLDGNLASIQSTDQYAFLRDLIYKTAGSHKRTWVGGSDSTKEGVWLWSDGSKFVFSGWAKGEPSNYGEGQGCMEMNYKGKAKFIALSENLFAESANDDKCDKEKPFLCARDP